MKPTPFLLLLSRLNRRPLPEQIILLRTLVHQQSLRSVQRLQLETLLTAKMTQQLRRENKEKVA